jgi:hypothetical protein
MLVHPHSFTQHPHLAKLVWTLQGCRRAQIDMVFHQAFRPLRYMPPEELQEFFLPWLPKCRPVEH